MHIIGPVNDKEKTREDDSVLVIYEVMTHGRMTQGNWVASTSAPTCCSEVLKCSGNSAAGKRFSETGVWLSQGLSWGCETVRVEWFELSWPDEERIEFVEVLGRGEVTC